MLRFPLVDPVNRLFGAERWCFFGSIDNWYPLSKIGRLDTLVEELAKHLDQESFFEQL